jgi:hypothetical protein
MLLACERVDGLADRGEPFSIDLAEAQLVEFATELVPPLLRIDRDFTEYGLGALPQHGGMLLLPAGTGYSTSGPSFARTYARMAAMSGVGPSTHAPAPPLARVATRPIEIAHHVPPFAGIGAIWIPSRSMSGPPWAQSVEGVNFICVSTCREPQRGVRENRNG